MQRFGLVALLVATVTFQVVSTPLLGQDIRTRLHSYKVANATRLEFCLDA